MAKKIRKMLSLVVALCICVSVLPLQALAVEETTTETSTEVSPEGLDTEITTTTTTEMVTTTTLPYTELGKGETEFYFNVTDAEGNVTKFLIKTDEPQVGTALTRSYL